MQPNPSLKAAILDITNWIVERPECQDWMRYMRVEEDAAGTVLSKIMLAQLDDMKDFTGKTIEEHVRDIVRGNHQILYGICDKYMIAHEEMLKWINKWINIPAPRDNDPIKVKAWKRMNSVLDYYGKTGQFALQIGKRCNSSVTYIDQTPWFPYAKFRFRKHRTHFKTTSIEATVDNPRPLADSARFGFISSLELPVTVTQEWIDWFALHTIPLGFVATSAPLPWKKVAALPNVGFIYQYIPG